MERLWRDYPLFHLAVWVIDVVHKELAHHALVELNQSVTAGEAASRPQLGGVLKKNQVSLGAGTAQNDHQGIRIIGGLGQELVDHRKFDFQFLELGSFRFGDDVEVGRGDDGLGLVDVPSGLDQVKPQTAQDIEDVRLPALDDRNEVDLVYFLEGPTQVGPGPGDQFAGLDQFRNIGNPAQSDGVKDLEQGAGLAQVVLKELEVPGGQGKRAGRLEEI